VFLTRQELIEFTGYKVIRCQIAALNAFHIPYKIGIHGRPVVLKSEVQRLLSDSTTTQEQSPKEPNWNALGA
jgi:hypothetical protein